jgi:hypothetical protein
VNIQPSLNKPYYMKTYYDIHILSYSGDTLIINGVSYSQMMQIARANPNCQKIEVIKEYSKKINKY